MKAKTIQNIYGTSVLLALHLHVYNSLSLFGLKLFVFPLAFAIVFSAFMKHSRTDWLILSLPLISMVTALFTWSTDIIYQGISLLVIVIAVRKFTIYHNNRLLAINSILTFLSCLILLRHSEIVGTYRYQGFYDDPNYFSLTLVILGLFIVRRIVVSFSCGMDPNNKVQYVLFLFTDIFSLVMIVYFSLLSASRTSFFVISILFVASLMSLARRSKIKALAVATLFVLIAPVVTSRFLTDTDSEFNILGERLFNQTNDNMSSASAYRQLLTRNGLEYVLDNPIYLVTGIGIGGTSYYPEIFVPNKYHRDHNTITSCLTEQGVIALIIFLILLFRAFRNLRFIQLGQRIFFQLGFIAVILFSLSIWSMTYLPFWVFIVASYNLDNEYYLDKRASALSAINV